MKKKIMIEGMSCNHCVMHVENALKDIEGVHDAYVNLNEKYATVDADDAISNETLKAAVEDAGYDVVNIM